MGSKKFSGTAPWNSSICPRLNQQEQEQLKWLCNHSLAQKTWSSYATAEKLLKTCCSEKNIPLTLPLSEETLIRFVLWLSFERKVSHSTISCYLAGVRQLHIQHGTICPNTRSATIKALLKGKENSEFAANTNGLQDKRRPITPELLLLLKNAITNWHSSICDKRMLWSACSLMFFGAFRSSELLCDNSNSFDPRYTLCQQDVKLVENPSSREKRLLVLVKTPKEEKRGRNIEVSIHQASSATLCAVTAWEKWQVYRPQGDPTQPLFRWENGTLLTTSQLNGLLKQWLGENFSSHSFRIGAASHMGQLGYQDKDIQALGRWRSNAFESYIRLGKLRRNIVARNFCKQV